MENTFRVVLTRWKSNQNAPYTESLDEIFSSEEAAFKAIEKRIADELKTLDNTSESRFSSDFDGDHDAIIRLWNGDSYKPVTAYDIHNVQKHDCKNGTTFWSYRDFWIHQNYDRTQVYVSLGCEICEKEKIEDILDRLDEYLISNILHTKKDFEKEAEEKGKHYVCLHEWVKDECDSYYGVIAVKHSMAEAKEAIKKVVEEEKAFAEEKGYVIYNDSDSIFDAGNGGFYAGDHCKVWIERLTE